MSEIKLKPCPFCGGEAKIKIKCKPFFSIGCECTECGAKTNSYCPNLESENALDSIESCKKMAIEAWDTRKPMEQIVERLYGQRFLNSYEPVNIGWNKAIFEAIRTVKEVGGMND